MPFLASGIPGHTRVWIRISGFWLGLGVSTDASNLHGYQQTEESSGQRQMYFE